MGLNLKWQSSLSIGSSSLNNTSAVVDCAASDGNLIEIVDNILYSEYVTAVVTLANAETINVSPRLEVVRFIHLETDRKVRVELVDFVPNTFAFDFERMFTMFGEWDTLSLTGIDPNENTVVKVIAVGGPVNP